MSRNMKISLLFASVLVIMSSFLILPKSFSSQNISNDNYSDFMEINLMSNGEEEVVEKEISRHPIAPFLNIDRIIKVGEEYRKYIGEFYIASENYSDLADINSIVDMEKSKLEYKKAVSFQSGLLDKGPGDFFDEEFNDNRWCKNDRKIELLADLSIAQTWEPNIGTYIYDARH